jgi:hypothetical protein
MAKDLTVIESGLNNLDLSRLKEFNIKPSFIIIKPKIQKYEKKIL